jgi:hypothetical protein
MGAGQVLAPLQGAPGISASDLIQGRKTPDSIGFRSSEGNDRGALRTSASSSLLCPTEAFMAEIKRQPRESISTRIDPNAHAVIEKIAEERRTTAAQVARVLLEDGAKELGRHDAQVAQTATSRR